MRITLLLLMLVSLCSYSQKFVYTDKKVLGRCGCTLYPYIFVDTLCNSTNIIPHELIHYQQIRETGVVQFYIFYLVEAGSKSLIHWSFKKGYRNTSFERDAIDFEKCYTKRKRFGWMKRILK